VAGGEQRLKKGIFVEDRIADAVRMTEAFLSVGTKRFDLSQTGIDGVGHGYRPNLNEGAMRLMLPYWIPQCWMLGQNLILRPRREAGRAFAQLDDLGGERLGAVRPVAFLCVETSPGNFQAWVAIKAGSAGDIKRLKHGVGSDARANGSVRIAGSPNCKRRYAPDFPVVRTAGLQPGCVVTPQHLEELGLMRDPAPAAAVCPRAFAQTRRGWPDYSRVLRGAPRKHDGTADRSKADYMWSKWALERGYIEAEVEAKLFEVSEKARAEFARGNGRYAFYKVASARGAVR